MSAEKVFALALGDPPLRVGDKYVKAWDVEVRLRGEYATGVRGVRITDHDDDGRWVELTLGKRESSFDPIQVGEEVLIDVQVNSPDDRSLLKAYGFQGVLTDARPGRPLKFRGHRLQDS